MSTSSADPVGHLVTLARKITEAHCENTADLQALYRNAQQFEQAAAVVIDIAADEAQAALDAFDRSNGNKKNAKKATAYLRRAASTTRLGASLIVKAGHDYIRYYGDYIAENRRKASPKARSFTP